MNRYEALQHAVRAHRGDTDWGGQPYILHPMAVADRIEAHMATLPPYFRNVWGAVEDAIVVALLHDVLEDTKYMLPQDDLTPPQWRGLQLVTRFPNETYFDYVRSIASAAAEGDSRAAIVKLADLSHNMSDERKVGLTDEQLEQARGLTEKRYLPSRDIIWDSLGGYKWWPE